MPTELKYFRNTDSMYAAPGFTFGAVAGGGVCEKLPS